MMPNRIVQQFTLTILSGAQPSGALNFTKPMQNASSLHIYSPATLPETVTVRVDPGDGTYRILQSAGADVAVTAGDMTVVDIEPGWENLRLQSGTNVAADRAFIVKLVEGGG